MSVVICRYSGFYLRRLKSCPTCMRWRRMVQWCRIMDDPILTCCGCGDSWSREGRMSRPFARGWREDAITKARKDYAGAGGKAEYDAWMAEQLAEISEGWKR